MNVTLLRIRVVIDVFKLRQSHIGLGWALNPMAGVHIKRMRLGDTDIQEHKGERTCADEGRDYRDILTCLRPRTAGDQPHSWEEVRKDSSQEPSEGVADT